MEGIESTSGLVNVNKEIKNILKYYVKQFLKTTLKSKKKDSEIDKEENHSQNLTDIFIDIAHGCSKMSQIKSGFSYQKTLKIFLILSDVKIILEYIKENKGAFEADLEKINMSIFIQTMFLLVYNSGGNEAVGDNVVFNSPSHISASNSNLKYVRNLLSELIKSVLSLLISFNYQKYSESIITNLSEFLCVKEPTNLKKTLEIIRNLLIEYNPTAGQGTLGAGESLNYSQVIENSFIKINSKLI